MTRFQQNILNMLNLQNESSWWGLFVNPFYHSISQNCKTLLHLKFRTSWILSDRVFRSTQYDRVHVYTCNAYKGKTEIALTLLILDVGFNYLDSFEAISVC